MKRVTCALAAAILIAGLSGASLKAADEVAPNTLTAAEKAAGWKLLFDGSTTAGWRGYKKTTIPDGWKVVDGVLTRVGKGGDIITVDEYENFELAFEWKIAPKGNSGVFYRGLETEGPIFVTAPEYQLVDNAGHPDAKNGPDRHAGANYALDAPVKDVSRPAGEWNSSKIVVNGAHVEHWLNGVKVVEYELWTDEWKRKVAASKFVKMPRYGLAKKGYIGLQDHGDEVAFRSIKIRVLPGSATE